MTEFIARNFALNGLGGAESDLLTRVDLGGIEKIVMEVHPSIFGPDATRGLLAHLQAAGFASVAQSDNGEFVYLSK